MIVASALTGGPKPSAGDYNAKALGGSGTGSVDWNDLGSVQEFRGLANKSLTEAQSRLNNITPDTDFKISAGNPYNESLNIINPYFSQGLGPETYDGKFFSDQARDEIRWFEASERKFSLREEELKGIAAAGGQEAYDVQQAGRAAQGVPFAQGARSAELLRQTRQGQGPRAGGGAAQGGAGRQARRLASNDRTTGSSGGGGSSANGRSRAANLLRQPLGAGSQSAAQLLG
jgi:hypothetical protein